MKAVTLAAMLVLASTGAAIAHGAAMWIQQGGYKTPEGDPCCGPSDCSMDMASDVVPNGDGWKILSTGQTFTRDQPEVFPSVDQHFWTCRKYPARLGASAGLKFVRCLFVPTQS